MSAPAQVLFDATKAEMAGNADWVIDADAHDLGVNGASNGSGVRGGGNESDPQRVPTPAISGITSTTKETYWQGALSAWAVTLAKNGQTVIETLPVFTTTTGSRTSATTVTLPVNGLAPGTTCHYRIVITSADGTVNGMDTTFTTPASVDSDGDGIPDDYETAHGLNPHDATDALLDADGDGQSNLAEYLAGTDPANPTDAFCMLTVAPSAMAVTVQFTTVFGKRYVVERTDSLINPNWSALGAVLNGNGTPLSVTDGSRQTGDETICFYRARIVP